MIGAGIRKPLGGLAIIAALAVYAWGAASLSATFGRLPILAQAALYLVVGVAWVPMLMPLVRFIETGRFTKGQGGARPDGIAGGDGA